MLAGGVAMLAAAGGLAPPLGASRLPKREIPSSGETIPILGMGTWITFNIGDNPEALTLRVEVLRRLLAGGGGMVDSSPMYGTAEAVIGRCLARLGSSAGLFATTKVWTSSESEGRAQIDDSFRLWGVDRFDLFQVHNLLGLETQLATLRAAREAGRIRYIGITTSHGRRHDDMAAAMRRERLDFIQFTYNPLDREAESRLLPLARDQGVGVIVNRPFRRGGLIDLTRGKPLPGFAAELGAKSWAQLILKFALSHPAVTVAIPATANPDHMTENLDAARGPLPNADLRDRITDAMAAL